MLDFREILPADIEDLRELYAANREYNRLVGADENNADSLVKSAANLRGVFEGGELVGCVDYITVDEGEVVYLGLLMTKRQGEGIGSRILSEFLRAAKRDGRKKIRLACGVDNKKAERFWLRNGFSQRGIKWTKKPASSEEWQVIIMEKNL